MPALLLLHREDDPDQWLELAYSDDYVVTQVDDGYPRGPGSGGTMPTSSASSPVIVALMLAALDAQPGHQVLEIGTGTGYNAALLAHRLGAEHVTSIEIDPGVAVHGAQSSVRHRLRRAHGGHRGRGAGGLHRRRAHVHVTRAWLGVAAASTELQRQAAFLAHNLAREHNDTPWIVSAAYGLAETLIRGGAFTLAKTVIDNTTLPPVTVETASLVSATLAMPHALLIAALGGDPKAPLDEATEIAERFSLVYETDPYGFYYGPTNIGTRQIGAALELGRVDEAVRWVHTVHPERNPHRSAQALHWSVTGRALAYAGGPVDEPVCAFLRSEALLPVKLYRDLRTREVLRELQTRAPDHEQLQQLAQRASLDQL